MPVDAFDMSKMHIYFCIERIGSNKCYKGALETFCGGLWRPPARASPQSSGRQTSGRGTVAAEYEAMMRAGTSLDQSGAIPSVDLMLLGTGDDGHCGSLYVPAVGGDQGHGPGEVVRAIDEGDKKSIAVSMDFMNTSKPADPFRGTSSLRPKGGGKALAAVVQLTTNQCVIYVNASKKILFSAGEGKRAEMVKRAVMGDFPEWDCPAGLVDASGETHWFVDT